MAADPFILKKLFATRVNCNFFMTRVQIAPGSSASLDLLALKELESQLLETENFARARTSLTSLQTNQTQH